MKFNLLETIAKNSQAIGWTIQYRSKVQFGMLVLLFFGISSLALLASTSAFSNLARLVFAPAITSISPATPMTSPVDQNVTVFGSGFQSGLTVTVTFPGGGTGTLSGSQIQSVTSTSFVMVVTLNATGTWSIRVNNPGGGGQSNTFSFTVQAASPPSISSISPSSPSATIGNQNVSVFGNNFQQGLTVTVTFPSGGQVTLSGSQIQSVTATSFVMVIDFSGNSGNYSIRVNNPNGLQSSNFGFTVRPVINSISPSNPVATVGNQNVSVFGSGFQQGLTVTVTFPSGGQTTLSGSQIQSVTVTSFVMVIDFSGNAGSYSIRVNNPNGTQSNSFSFTAQSVPLPVVSSISPSSPSATIGNQNVSVFGNNFQQGLTVTVTFPSGGQVTLSGSQIQSVTTTSFVMVIDFNGNSGLYSMRVNNPNGTQSSIFGFMVRPVITSISPSSPVATVGNQNVSILGSGFQAGLTVTVTFPSGGQTTLSGSQIQSVTVTSFVMVIDFNGIAGSYSIRVNNPNGTQSNIFGFSAQQVQNPIINSIAPPNPLATVGNQNVSVSGNNFLQGLTVTVTFPSGGQITLSGSQILNVTTTSFVMVIDFNGNPGNYSIRVNNPNGTLSNNFGFTVQPVINSISPASPVATVGNQNVSVLGSGFQQGLTVTVTFPSGGQTTLSGSQIQSVTVTSFVMVINFNGNTGSYSIRVNNLNGTLSNTFGFTAQGPLTPTLSSINPLSTPTAGQQFMLRLNGLNFNTSTIQVLVNGQSCAPCVVPNNVITATSSMQIDAPLTLINAGTFQVSVRNGSIGAASNSFPVIVNGAGQTPTLDNIAPLTTPVVGQQFTLRLTGTNFNSSTAQVLVNGASCPPCVVPNEVFFSKSATQIDAPVTLNTTGTFQVSVRNGQSGAPSNSFPISAQSGPAVSWIDPASPVATGIDQDVIVHGNNFQPSLTVAVTLPGGQVITLQGSGQIQNVTSSSFRMKILFGNPGAWSIRVKNPNNLQSIPYPFTVRAPAPTISNISPSTVTAGQATPLTIMGSNFQNGFSASVTPNGTIAGLHFDSGNQVRLDITLGGMPPYTATLRITNPDGQSATRTFSVTGTAVPPLGLSGKLLIKDGQNNIWRLNGSGIINLTVTATPIGGGAPVTVTAQDGQYSFSNLALGQYNLTVSLRYRDTIGIDNRFHIGNGVSNIVGCDSTILTKTTQLSRQVDTSNNTNQDIFFPPPIVMVHGVLSCYARWYEIGQNTEYWDNYARAQGFITFTPNFHYNLLYSWPTRANEIKGQVEYNLKGLTRVIGDNNDNVYPPWFYIAHSMGGLVARALTGGASYNSPAVKSLQKLYLLGTPSSGSNLRIYGLLSGLGGLTEGDIRGTFNQTDRRRGSFPSFGGKDVVVYAGTNGQGGDTSNDGEVHVDSVHNIYKAECYIAPTLSGWICRSNRLVTSLDRLPDTGQRYNHTGLGSPTSRYELLIQRILPDICGLSGISCNSLPTLATLNATSTMLPTEDLVGLRNISKQTKSLSSSQSSSLSFKLTATDLMKVVITVSSGSASFSLIDPAGQVIDFSSLPSSAGERVITEAGESYILNNPVVGAWSLQALAGTSGSTFDVIILENSPLGFEGFTTNPTSLIGQPLLLIGQWSGDQTGLTLPSVVAQITDEADNTVANLILSDDGAHQDGAAGDGIFGTETPILANSGHYTVTFTAQGSLNGQAFTRWAEATVDIVVSTHLFTGSFSDTAVDSDTNGTYDTVRSTIGVSALAAGNYLVTADLQDAQGYYIDHAVGYLEATAAGVYSVNLDFRMAGAVCSQYGAPFTIKNLTLSDASTLTALDVYADNVVITQTYSGSLFGCTAGTPAPVAVSVQPSSLFPGASGQVFINGSSFADGAQVSFGSGVTVSSVTYGGSTTLLAQVSVAAGAATGLRDVTVTNLDGRSSTATGLFSVASDQLPTVAISNLSNQQNLSGTVTVSASANDDLGVQRVEFYLDNALANTDTSFPYQFVWNTSTSSNGAHTVLVKAFDTAGQMATAQVSVNAGCSFSLLLGSQSFPASGGNGMVNITTTSVCQWAAVSNATWITVNGTPSGAGNGSISYSVAANTGAARTGTITIGGQQFMVNQACGATAILSQLVNQTVCAGAPVSFFVTASGAGPFTYQWRKNGSNITGATGSVYTISAVVAGNAGSYDVVVMGGCGNATSNAATLTVNSATTIATQPTNQTVCAGAPASFTVTANGTGPFTYQWRKNGLNVSGATGSTFNIASVTANDAGSYDVIVTGACGSATSNAAVLTVNTAPSITTQPVNQTACPGGNATFTVAASGGPTPTVQWQASADGGVNYTNINGATNMVLTLTGVTGAQNGYRYRAVLANSCGSTMSAAATLTVTSFSIAPSSQNFSAAGGAGSVAVTAGTSCNWTAISNDAWITVNTGASGSGNGTVQYSVSANTGLQRTGTMTIAGQTFTVTQAGAITNTLPFAAGTFFDRDAGLIGTAFLFDPVTTSGTLPFIDIQGPTGWNAGSSLRASLYQPPGIAATRSIWWQFTQPITGQYNAQGSAGAQSFQGQASVNSNSNLAPPQITGLNVGTGQVTLTWNADSAAQSFLIRVNPIPFTGITGETVVSGSTRTATLTGLSLTSGAQYQAIVIAFSLDIKTPGALTGPLNIGNHAIAFTAGCAGPSISTQPINRSVCSGSATSFSVSATGAGLGYQWRKDGISLVNGGNISGANAPTLNINSATLTNAGSYDVVITNACGVVTSNAATLTVNTPLNITAHPSNQTAAAGGNASFVAAASGNPAPGVQWQVSTDGGTSFNNLSGATNATLTLTNIGAILNGNRYRAIFSNACGSVTTTAATLTVSCPTISVNPSNSTLPAGMAGQPYNQLFTGAGGVSSYSFTVSAGTLPTGLSLLSSGTLSGTPTGFGPFSFTVKATDANGCMGTRAYSLVIAPPCPAITVNPSSLPNGTTGVAYNQPLTASGGTASYSFTVTGGALPAGLALSSGGSLTGTPITANTFTFTVTATDANNCTGSRSYTVTIGGTTVAGLQYYPLPKPIRLFDTRAPIAGFPACAYLNAPLIANQEREFLARTMCDGVSIPADAQAIVGNATVTGSTQGGVVTIWPNGQARPPVSNLNYTAGQSVPNAFTVGLGGDGKFRAMAFSDTQFIVDITGYYAPPSPTGLYYHPLPRPIRLLDTRAPIAGFPACAYLNAPLIANQEREFQARISCDGVTIPADAQAIVGNGTVTGSTQGGVVTIWPNGQPRPPVSNLNYTAGQTVPNAFTVGLSADGTFRVMAFSDTQFIVDITGYYSASPSDANGAGLLYSPLARPIRLFDTRAPIAGFPACEYLNAPLIANQEREFLARISCDGISIPSTAQAIVGNGTVTGSTVGGVVTIWPNGQARPPVSNLNYTAGQTVPNAFTVGLGADGKFRVMAFSGTQFIVDVAGYFAP